MKNFALFASLLLLGGCANHSTVLHMNQNHYRQGLDLEITAPSISKAEGSTKQITNHYFLGGVLQRNDVNVNKVCKGRSVQKVMVEQRWYQTLFTFITFGIYSPMTTTVYCGR